MFDVYRMTPRGRRVVGSFEDVKDIPAGLKISSDDVMRMVVGEAVNKMQIDVSYKFMPLAEPMTQKQIAQKLGVKVNTIEKRFSRAIQKLNEKGVLHEMLSMIRELREIEEKHRGTYEIELSTKITISRESE